MDVTNGSQDMLDSLDNFVLSTETSTNSDSINLPSKYSLHSFLKKNKTTTINTVLRIDDKLCKISSSNNENCITEESNNIRNNLINDDSNEPMSNQPQIPKTKLQPHHLYHVMISCTTRRIDGMTVQTEENENFNTPLVEHANFSETPIILNQTGLTDLNQNTTDDKGANSTLQSLRETCTIFKFDKDQTKAFLLIISHIILAFIDTAFTNSNKPVNKEEFPKLFTEIEKLTSITNSKETFYLFLDGARGTGKSKVLNEVLRYTQDFCELLGTQFNQYTILMTATSGVAATLIRGSTVHSALHLNRRRLASELIENFHDVKLIVIDKISMMDLKTLKKVERRLQKLGRQNEFYGSFNMVFVGDFRQLEPVKNSKGAIYKNYKTSEWEILNSYIELKGQFRFASDPEWGEILNSLCSGTTTQQQISKINQRVVNRDQKTTIFGHKIPTTIRYASPTNIVRDVVHTKIISEIMQKSPQNVLFIFADKLEI